MSENNDIISRRAAIDEILGQPPEPHYPSWYAEQIKNLPSLHSGRIRGKWIETSKRSNIYYCDKCRNFLDFSGVNAGRGDANYCPNCGADMRDDDDIVKEILHRAIDNTRWAEDAYPNIKERLHKMIDEYEE